MALPELLLFLKSQEIVIAPPADTYVGVASSAADPSPNVLKKQE